MKWNPFKRTSGQPEKPKDQTGTPVADLDARYSVVGGKEIDFGMSTNPQEEARPMKAFEWLQSKADDPLASDEVFRVDLNSKDTTVAVLLEQGLHLYAEAHDKGSLHYSIIEIHNPTDVSEYKQELLEQRTGLETFIQVYASKTDIKMLKGYTFSVGKI